MTGDDTLMALINKSTGLWLLFALQAGCALFFFSDAAADMFGIEPAVETADNDVFEAVVVIALVLSLGFTGLELRKLLGRHKRMEDQLKVASGAFAQLLDEHFADWALTPSERDVAILALKGFTIADMARVRETKEGTIKAQCAAIYRKAGVSGRPQLMSLFIEDLLTDNALASGDTPTLSGYRCT